MLALGLAGLAFVSCNRRPAELALAETESALAPVRPQLERHAPSALARIELDLQAAREHLAKGEYTEALRIAQRLPERVALTADCVASKRRELLPIWNRVAGSLPAALAALDARVAEIEAGVRHPRGFDAAQLESAKAELAEIRGGWARAEAVLRAGDVIAATSTASELEVKAGALAVRLNPSPASVASPGTGLPRPAATPKPSPPPVPAPETVPESAPPPPETASPPPEPPATEPEPPPTAMA